MHHMTEGQTVYVRCGIPAKVIKPPESIAGLRALVEFQDGTREWIITPHIFASLHEARADSARQTCGEVASKVRTMEQELWIASRELEKARAVVYAEEGCVAAAANQKEPTNAPN